MNATLSRHDTALLKGFAIIAIVLHNFCHWLPQCVLENEYTFSVALSMKLVGALGAGQHVVLNLFSFFGHYGVPVFLFLSGYGLVMKYECAGSPRVGAGAFMKHHALKLWRLLALGLGLWLVQNFIEHNGRLNVRWEDVAGLLTFTVNFFPRPHLHQLLGPWWFFSLMMQLYLVYRLLLYRRGLLPLAVLTVACVLLQLCVLEWGDARQEELNYLRYNFPGGMLPFAAGVTMARYGLKSGPVLTAVSIILIVAGCFNGVAWTLAPLFVVTASLQLVSVRGVVRRVVEWVGRLSAVIFVVHPIVRSWVMDLALRSGQPYVALLIYLTVTLIVALAYRRLTSFLWPVQKEKAG